MDCISYRKRGFGLIFWPSLVLVLLIGVYFFINILLSQNTNPEQINIRMKLQFLVFFLGTFTVFTLPIFIPLGIFLLFKKPVIIKNLPPKKYKNIIDTEILYIHDFSWGALLGSFIWTLGNKLYRKTIELFIPGWNIYVWIQLFIDGRKIAWEQNKWKNYKQFYRQQWRLTTILTIFYSGLFYWAYQKNYFEYIVNNVDFSIINVIY